MNVAIGRITAELTDPAAESPSRFLDLINRNIKPPSPLGEDDIHVRAMFIVSDEINSFGGRFPDEELHRLTGLLIDSPVLVAHRKDDLPVARTFHAEIVTRHDHPWVKSYFYWLSSAAGAGDLLENIDGGIYKECSIGFTFTTPECSICGRDIRTCNHHPFEQYSVNGHDSACHFIYRGVQKVLETSLVYRGAHPNTGITKDLTDHRSSLDPSDPGYRLSPLADLDDLPADRQYVAIPHYDAVPVIATMHGDRLDIRRLDGGYICPDICRRFRPRRMPGLTNAVGLIVGYRGRTRLPREAVATRLEKATLPPPVPRLELKLFPHSGLPLPIIPIEKSPADLCALPYRCGTRDSLDRLCREVATRDGVEIWPADTSPALATGYLWRDAENERDATPSQLVWLTYADRREALLTVRHGPTRHHFRVCAFHPARFRAGSRFVADALDRCPDDRHTTCRRTAVELTELRRTDGGLIAQCPDYRGPVVIRPIQLDGRRRFIVYMRGTSSN